MALFSRHRRLVAWLAIVALLCNALAVFAPAKAAHVVVDDLLGPMVICASDGAAALVADDGTQAPAHSRSSHCPDCTLVKHVVLAFAAPISEFPAPPRGVRKLGYSPPASVASHLSRGGIRSRAPPHQA
jgi:hypothetical protein